MYHVKHILDNISLLWKIMIAFIIALLIPLSFSGTYIYLKSVQSLETQSKKALQEMQMQKKKDIENKISDYENIAKQIAKTPIFVSYFNNFDIIDIEKINITYMYLNPFMEWVKSLDSSEFDFRFFTSNNNTFENSRIYHSDQFKNENWFIKASTSTYAVPYLESFHKKRVFDFSQIFDAKDRDSYELSIFIPIITEYKNKGTLLEIYIKPDSLFSTLNNSVFSNQGVSFVLGENREIIYSVNSSKIFSDMVLQYASISNISLSSEIIEINRESYILNIQTIKNTKLKIISLYLLEDLMNEVYKARNIFILSIIFAVVVMFLIAYALSHGLVKRVRNLVKVMRIVQDGDLDVNAEVNGNDEISELSRDFNIMICRIRDLIDKVYKYEIMKKDTMLKVLENQINPHFLYNSLETIRMMALMNRDKGVSNALTSLGSIIRYNLSRDTNLIPLYMEIKQIESYCEMQNLMLNNRLKLIIDIDESILQFKIPKLVLQPIVENCIIHGFHNYDSECNIIIFAQQFHSKANIIIQDNGNGISVERLNDIRNYLDSEKKDLKVSSDKNGIGMKNVHQRLKLKFGNEFGLVIRSVFRQGTEVVVSIPIIL